MRDCWRSNDHYRSEIGRERLKFAFSAFWTMWDCWSTETSVENGAWNPYPWKMSRVPVGRSSARFCSLMTVKLCLVAGIGWTYAAIRYLGLRPAGESLSQMKSMLLLKNLTGETNTRLVWRASLVPAAVIIPAPIAYKVYILARSLRPV